MSLTGTILSECAEVYNILNQVRNSIIFIKVGNANFLGLIIDDDLSWRHHIIKVTSKISKLCGIMARARHYLPIRTLYTLLYIMLWFTHT